MNKCPKCNSNLNSFRGVRRVTDSDIKWYKFSAKPIEHYFECAKCKTALNRKGVDWTWFPILLAVTALNLTSGILYDKDQWLYANLIVLLPILWLSWYLHQKTNYEEKN